MAAAAGEIWTDITNSAPHRAFDLAVRLIGPAGTTSLLLSRPNAVRFFIGMKCMFGHAMLISEILPHRGECRFPHPVQAVLYTRAISGAEHLQHRCQGFWHWWPDSLAASPTIFQDATMEVAHIRSLVGGIVV